MLSKMETIAEGNRHSKKSNKPWVSTNNSLNGTERKSTRSIINDAVFYFWGHNLWSHRVYRVSYL